MCAYKKGFQNLGKNGEHCYAEFYFSLVLSEISRGKEIMSRKGYQDWTTRRKGIKTVTDKTKKGGRDEEGGGIGRGDVVGTM